MRPPESLRRDGTDLGPKPLDEVIEAMVAEAASRALEPTLG